MAGAPVSGASCSSSFTSALAPRRRRVRGSPADSLSSALHSVDSVFSLAVEEVLRDQLFGHLPGSLGLKVRRHTREVAGDGGLDQLNRNVHRLMTLRASEEVALDVRA